MYTATFKEIKTFLRAIDLTTPRTPHRIAGMLRDRNKQHWFNEDRIETILKEMHAETLTLPNSAETYYYIDPKASC